MTVSNRSVAALPAVPAWAAASVLIFGALCALNAFWLAKMVRIAAARVCRQAPPVGAPVSLTGKEALPSPDSTDGDSMVAVQKAGITKPLPMLLAANAANVKAAAACMWDARASSAVEQEDEAGWSISARSAEAPPREADHFAADAQIQSNVAGGTVGSHTPHGMSLHHPRRRIVQACKPLC